MGKTTRIHSEARKIILKVLAFFDSEKSNKQFLIPVDQVIKRACAATGVSKKTIMRIKKEARENALSPTSDSQEPSTSTSASAKKSSQTTSASAKKSEPKKPTTDKKKWVKKVVLDHFDLCILKNIVDGYNASKTVPTLRKILKDAKSKIFFPGGLESMRRVLVHQLGYKFIRCEDGRQVLVHNTDIAEIITPDIPDNLAPVECIKIEQEKPAPSECVEANDNHQGELANLERIKVTTEKLPDPESIQVQQWNLHSECIIKQETIEIEIDQA